MRVNLDKYQRARSSMQLKTIFMIVMGGIGVVFFSFITLLGFLLIVAPADRFWERRGGFVVAIFPGLFPLIASLFVMWKGFSFRARFDKMKELAALARLRPAFSREEMAQALGLSVQAGELVLVEAISEQIVVAGPEDYAPRALGPAFAPVISAPSPRVVITPDPHAPRLSAPSELGPTGPAVQLDLTDRPIAITPGVVLGNTYRIESALGAGGMGEVYVASHVRTGRKYAVKTLPQDSRLSPDAIKRFEREALAASALGHPNIVAVHDFNREGNTHYLVMDLYEGETLATRLERFGSLPWADAQRIALEIGSALAVAHDAGLLHRDIKPANVLLASQKDADERAILLDFGLVKTIDDAMISRITRTGAVIGTPVYMSPEQARGEPLTVTSDVYSLGALVYEMVTGAPPFMDRVLANVYVRLLNDSAERASKVAMRPLPPGLDAVLDRALAKQPSARYPSARAFMSALSELGEEAPSTLRIA